MESGAADTVPAFLIGIGSCMCALPLDSIIETMRPLVTEPVRGCPDFIAGLSVVRGEPIPVVSLAALAGVRDAEVRRFVTLRTGERIVALAVEQVIGVRRLNAAALLEAPPLIGDLRPDVISRLGILDGALLMVLETAHLLPDTMRDVPTTDGIQP